MRLQKYMAHSGVASRRKSEEIISFRLRIIAPRLAGINKLKEKLKAFWGDKPNNKAEKIARERLDWGRAKASF